MKITTIGRGSVGGTLARLWTAAGHDVTQLGREGGDAGDADVVLLALPYAAVPDALQAVTGLRDQTVIDATNHLGRLSPPAGHASNAAYVRAHHAGPVVKAFNLNFASLLGAAADTGGRPDAIWTGDEEGRDAVETLIRDAGLAPLHAGPLEHAATQEAFGALLMAMVADRDEGLLVLRLAPPTGS